MKKYPLSGQWRLYFFQHDSIGIKTPSDLDGKDIALIPAEVPGNVELDLAKAGYLPSDLYKGENILRVQKFEEYDWWYETVFEQPQDSAGKTVVLCFEAVDCLAEYFLNDEKIGESENMFIPVEFDITEKLKKQNKLNVRLRPAVLEARKYDYPMRCLTGAWHDTVEALSIRKAPHSYGWDIMPRALSAGIWRDVCVVVEDEAEIRQLFYHLRKLGDGVATLRFGYELGFPPRGDLEIEISGKCGKSEFHVRKKADFKAGFADVTIKNPRLWMPYGYGEPSLYETTFKVIKDGKTLAEKTMNVGLRTVALQRTDTTDGKNGRFGFEINGISVMCKGSNWVPMDVFHSRDKARYEKALALVSDIGCNILRCWGGNVYEDDAFFDYCDKHGIMVWQDFAMACAVYPQDERFCALLEKEAESVIKRLRSHPSLILWSGDNECDQPLYDAGVDPNSNILTRKILPAAVAAHDMGRPYLPSSPYISSAVFEAGMDCIPENHLWGPRDYFKSAYYADSNAHFVSETGYHGCPSVGSLKRFIDEDALWPIENNRQWNLHSSDQKNRDHRVSLMKKQIIQLFGSVPGNLEDFVFASQASQAEAMKFFIENIRLKKPVKSGIIWWNLIDGWPQMSDAVVDYYYEKKLAYDYIKRSQQPFALMIGEISDWHVRVAASNDTLETVSGSYEIADADTGETLSAGEFSVCENANKELAKIPMMYSDKRLLLIKWTIGDKTYFNHYLCGLPPFELEQYRKWHEQLRHFSL